MLRRDKFSINGRVAGWTESLSNTQVLTRILPPLPLVTSFKNLPFSCSTTNKNRFSLSGLGCSEDELYCTCGGLGMLELKGSIDLCEIVDDSSQKKKLHSGSNRGLNFSS